MLGHDEDINSYEKRISELEADAKRWKDAFTTSQTHLDVVAEKLIPLLPGGWKHDWAGDVADGISERIAELEAERDRLHTRTGVLGAQVDEAKRERDRLLADNVALRAALEKVRGILHRQSKDPGFYPPKNFDEQQVLAIAQQHGYGNLMLLLSAKWYEKQRDGAFAVGECIGTNATTVQKIDAALTQPATTEALERVKTEAKAEALKQMGDYLRVAAGDCNEDGHHQHDLVAGLRSASDDCLAKAAELRGGE